MDIWNVDFHFISAWLHKASNFHFSLKALQLNDTNLGDCMRGVTVA